MQLIEQGRSTLLNLEADQWRSLGLTRFHLLNALGKFVSFKEEHILVPLILRSNQASRRAKNLYDRNHDLQLTYDRFIQRWCLKGTMSAHDDYSAEAMDMAVLIERQVSADIVELKELLRISFIAEGRH